MDKEQASSTSIGIKKKRLPIHEGGVGSAHELPRAKFPTNIYLHDYRRSQRVAIDCGLLAAISHLVPGSDPKPAGRTP